MEIQIKTQYNTATMTAGAMALRKTFRRRNSRITHALAVVIVAAALFVGIENVPKEGLGGIGWPSLLVGLRLAVVILKEDQINGWIGLRQIISSGTTQVVTFGREGYQSTSDVAVSQWSYGNIKIICELPGHFVFLFDKKHAQVFDKSGFLAGSREGLVALLEEQTGRKVMSIS